eukprot:1624730-Lingulodinium_polyedra.AAC.1
MGRASKEHAQSIEAAFTRATESVKQSMPTRIQRAFKERSRGSHAHQRNEMGSAEAREKRQGASTALPAHQKRVRA